MNREQRRKARKEMVRKHKLAHRNAKRAALAAVIDAEAAEVAAKMVAESLAESTAPDPIIEAFHEQSEDIAEPVHRMHHIARESVARGDEHARDMSAEATGFALEHIRAMHANRRLCVDEKMAREMLSQAALMLSDVLNTVQIALDSVSPEERNEALLIIKTPPEPSLRDRPQQRPRRAHNPVVTLMRMGMQAANLLNRIIGRLHPKLGQAAKAA